MMINLVKLNAVTQRHLQSVSILCVTDFQHALCYTQDHSLPSRSVTSARHSTTAAGLGFCHGCSQEQSMASPPELNFITTLKNSLFQAWHLLDIQQLLQWRTVDVKPTSAQLHHHIQEHAVSSLTSTRQSTTAAVKTSRCQAYQCSTSSPHSRTLYVKMSMCIRYSQACHYVW